MKLKEQFCNYDSVDLIISISSHFLDKRNMEGNLSILQAVHIAIQKAKESKEQYRLINIKHLTSLINKCEETSDVAHLQDPSEELFTDNVLFHGGNFTIFPGITSDSNYILDLLLTTIFSELPSGNNQEKSLFFYIQALLKVSNHIAEMSKIPPFEKYPESQTNFRTIFTPSFFENKKKALILDDDALMDLLTSEERIEILKRAIRVEDYPEEVFDAHNCVLTRKPLVKVGNTIVVADPTSICSAIRHELIIFYTRSEVERKKILKSIKKNELSRIAQNFNLLQYKRIKVEHAAMDRPECYEEILFQVDDTKICFIQILFDDYRHYDPDNTFGLQSTDEDQFAFSEKRHLDLYKEEISKKIGDYGYYHILLLVPSGRGMAGGFSQVPDGCKSITLLSSDIEIIVGLRKNDKYYLLKLAEALESLHSSQIQYIPFSSLDIVGAFDKYNQSFYMTDEFKPTMITFSGDFGRKLREEKAILNKRHNAFHYSGYLIPVVRKELNSQIPIYFSFNSVASGYELLVKTETLTWVKVESKDKISTYVYTEMASYWIWQITASLEKVPPHVICIDFEDEYIKSLERVEWSQGEEIIDDHIVSIEEIEKYFTISLEKPFIRIKFKVNLLPIILKSKNTFDRCFVKMILHVYNNNLCQIFKTEKMMDNFVNIVAPFGYKKMLTIQTSDTNPYLIEKVREKVVISDYFSGKYLNDLGKNVGERIFGESLEYRKFTDNERCKLFVICKEFYMSKIIHLSQSFNRVDLLISYLELYEAYLFSEKQDDVHFHTSIDCYSGIYGKIEKEKNRKSNIHGSMLACRFLIELTYCSEFNGVKRITDYELEEILSVASQYISWGLVADEVRCKVSDHQYSYLKSERIGSQSASAQEMKTFASRKLEEELTSKFLSERENNSSKLKKNDYAVIDDVFCEEFGLTYIEMIETVGGFYHKVTVLKKNLLSEKEIFENENVNNVQKMLNMMTLPWREHWERIPDGYEPHEILPWRFKRRLSCIMKPILKIEKKRERYYLIYPTVILNSLDYYFQKIGMAHFPNEYCASTRLKSYIGEKAKMLGRLFEKEIAQWVMSFKNEKIIVFSSLEIGPSHKLKGTNHLGDIDVLVINLSRNEIVVIEAKKISGSKTPVEISNELKNHFENFAGKKTSMDKHLARYNWIKENIAIVVEELRIPKRKYKVFHLFITDALIPSQFLSKLKYKITSFETIRWHGYANFRKHYK